MSSRSRSDVVAEFQDNSSDSPSVMLLSLRAGEHIKEAQEAVLSIPSI